MSRVPRFVVMMITVFLKSTVRPCASVRRPSSRICSSELKMSGWAFSISSNRTTENGLPRTFSGGGAEQPGARVLLHVLGHVELDQRVFVTEQELRERLGQLGLTDTRRAGE